MRRVGVLGVLSLTGLLAVPQAGQSPAPVQTPQTPVFRTSVDVVELDVSVLDKDRKPVTGLTVKDFAVFEDGQPRPIVNFSAVDLPVAVAPTAPWMNEVARDVESNDVAEHRLFVIMLDDALAGGDPWKVTQTRLAAIKAIDGLGPTDEAAVIFSGGGWNGQGFTSDHSRLKRAVETMGLTPTTGGGCVPLWSSMDALQGAAEALGGIPHRKKVVLFISVGPGFPLVGPTIGACAPRAQVSAQAALRFAQRGNVNIFGIDPSGLNGVGINDPKQRFLDDMSSNTGGHAVMNTNDIVSHIPEILEESHSYYLLGYQLADAQQDGRFHRLEVKLVDHPDFDVKARSSRLDSRPPDPKPDAGKKPPTPAQVAIGGYLPSTGLRIEATAAAFEGKGDTHTMRITLGVQVPVDARPMTKDRADVLIRAFSVDGHEAGSAHDVIPVEVEPGEGTEAAGHRSGDRFWLASKIELKPGRYALRIAVHSAGSDRTGSVYTDVVVPDFRNEPLSLSGVVVMPASGGSLSRDALDSLAPTTVRAFAATDRMQAFLRVYQGGRGALSPVTMTVRIANAQNAVVVDRAEPLPASAFARDQQADYRARLPLASLPPGEYWMSIEAAAGKATARRDVRFAIR
jgi:VWFA-related protein